MNAGPAYALSRDADSVLEGHDVPRGRVDGIGPEQALFRSVVVMAWHDAFVHSDWVLCNGKARSAAERAERGMRVRNEARRWLTMSWGTVAEDRETVCDMAGIDESVVRTLAIAKWAQVKQQEKPAKKESVDHKAVKHARVDLDKMLESLLRRTGDLDESDVDVMLADLAEDESERVLA